jgi:DNA helicase-2/ATP-dependent DNA helicase PcrA
MSALAVAAAPSDPFASLNPAQREAVLHGDGAAVPGPLLVIAGAGSGKTNTLACRVAHLVASGADPQRLLLLTFSRRAAAEMERRTGRMLLRLAPRSRAQVAATLPWAGTFHSVAARLLREYAARIGVPDTFTIHDRGDSEDLLALARHARGLDSTERRFPGKATCLAIYSRVVNGGAALGDVLRDAFAWYVPWEEELRGLFAAYVADKQAQHVLDYDDLLLYWAHMAGDAALGAEIGARFDHILVDEYQDTNPLQAAILRGLKPDGQGITVVGDDAQAIYSFRAATVRNILDFPAQFAPPARIVRLTRNYRSTQPILDASNAVIALAAERYDKDLWTERSAGARPLLLSVRDEADQARCVAERVLEHAERGTALRAQAVLFRSASHSAPLELELTRRGIPFVKYGGLRFLEAAHVKDVLATLRWIENPRSRIAGFRVARLMPGIGAGVATRLLDAMGEAADPVDALRAFRVPPAAADAWAEFIELLDALRGSGAEWPADVERIVRWYEPHLARAHDDAHVRRADLAQLTQIASTYPTRERFLTELTLDPPQATSDESGEGGDDDDYLILSTIHSAKGQEWKAVQVLNVVDGCIPSDLGTTTQAELEEERRLLYVAMTRAKDDLALLVPQRFYVTQQARGGDRHVYASRSRFIPDALLEHFDRCAWPAATQAGAAARAAEPCAPIDLAARMRALWR